MEENDDQVNAFVARHPAFEVASADEAGDVPPALRQAALKTNGGILMTPRRTGTDGFYLALLRRSL
jgi:16S rRNA (cytosine967-C5)-methyltransferase